MIIPRDHYLKKLVAGQGNGQIKIITGVRGSGKSFLLFSLFGDYLKEKGITEDHIIKVVLEDRRRAALRDPNTLLAYIDSKVKDQGHYYVLLDEVQHVKDFEDVLNSYSKVDNVDIYVEVIQSFCHQTLLQSSVVGVIKYMSVPYHLLSL